MHLFEEMLVVSVKKTSKYKKCIQYTLLALHKIHKTQTKQLIRHPCTHSTHSTQYIAQSLTYQ